MSTIAPLCDVCGKNTSIGVASSTFGAISFAYCRECLDKPADCEIMFDYVYDYVGNEGEGLMEEMNNWYTYKDGKYISWPEYKEWRRNAK